MNNNRNRCSTLSNQLRNQLSHMLLVDEKVPIMSGVAQKLIVILH